MRVHGEPLAILPAARKVVQQMDPNLPLIQPMTQRAQYELTISNQLLFARLAGFFGLLAVALVATGLYGTLAYRVNKRTAEIGIRMAMGARRGQVVWMVLRDIAGADGDWRGRGSSLRHAGWACPGVVVVWRDAAGRSKLRARSGGSGVRCAGSERVAGPSRRKCGAVDGIADGVAVPHSLGDRRTNALIQQFKSISDLGKWPKNRLQGIVKLQGPGSLPTCREGGLERSRCGGGRLRVFLNRH